MSKAELERLAILVEECAEIQQIAMKIIRHGYESYHPEDISKTSNRKLLSNELGDLVFAMALMFTNKDIKEEDVQEAKWDKKHRIQKYLHFNIIE